MQSRGNVDTLPQAAVGLKARDVIAWGEAHSAQPQEVNDVILKALKGLYLIAGGRAPGKVERTARP